MERLLLGGAAGDQRRTGVMQRHEQRVERRGSACPRIFLVPDDQLDYRKTLPSDAARPGKARPATIRLALLPRQRERA